MSEEGIYNGVAGEITPELAALTYKAATVQRFLTAEYYRRNELFQICDATYRQGSIEEAQIALEFIRDLRAVFGI